LQARCQDAHARLSDLTVILNVILEVLLLDKVSELVAAMSSGVYVFFGSIVIGEDVVDAARLGLTALFVSALQALIL
jgi:hypothetical protein